MFDESWKFFSYTEDIASILPQIGVSARGACFRQAGTNIVISLCPRFLNQSVARRRPRQENPNLLPWLKVKEGNEWVKQVRFTENRSISWQNGEIFFLIFAGIWKMTSHQHGLRNTEQKEIIHTQVGIGMSDCSLY